MFERLGHFVSRHWGILLVGWVLTLAVLFAVAPKWDDVIRDGDFGFLPEDVPSRKAESLFHRAFSSDPLESTIVIVARRDNSPDGLLDEDRAYIDETLVPRLAQVVGLPPAADAGGDAHAEKTTDTQKKPEAGKKIGAENKADHDGSASQKSQDKQPGFLAAGSAPPQPAGDKFEPVVARIRTFSDREIGQLLISEDQKATLIVLDLTTDFTERKNDRTLAAIEQLIGGPGHMGQLQREKGFPTSLDLSLSGSATVGRDMREAGRRSAKATEAATIVLVIVLLLAIYRAPFLATIPLLTVFISVEIAILVLSLMAKAGWVRLFTGIEVYVTVVLYGAGVDYCMFLMSRYKEELDNGATFDGAITTSVSRVGHALAASAGTVMCGIGMMIFTRFGKFQDAGIAMSFSLIFVLSASLTLAPALLRFAGRWTFWPRVQTERLSTVQGWISPTSLVSRLLEREWFGKFWDRVAKLLLARPGVVWLCAMALMIPFAVVAIVFQHQLSYGLLSELPKNDPSVVGAAAVQSHFPPGITGPVTILISNPHADFRPDGNTEDEKRPGWKQIQAFVDSIYEHRDELGLVDLRSVAYPLGMTDRVKSGALDKIRNRLAVKRAQADYVSDKPELAGRVTRIDVVLKNDPFSPDSMAVFDRLKEKASEYLPPELKTADTGPLEYLGTTPSIRDLKTITDGDQTRIDYLVPAVVFAILVVLLRRIATSGYLIFTVFFSYLVTLGVTFVVFYLLDRQHFVGLDWKVPMFLFTILVAVGEDYNILLMARIEEEQCTYGPVQGIVHGLRKTGSIISSCGIIMAGTFSALMFGSLEGLTQLGFALAFGVLLDTFVVRPILVPAYLILLNQGFFGPLSPLLGFDADENAAKREPVAVER